MSFLAASIAQSVAFSAAKVFLTTWQMQLCDSTVAGDAIIDDWTGQPKSLAPKLRGCGLQANRQTDVITISQAIVQRYAGNFSPSEEISDGRFASASPSPSQLSRE
jgi:hypothetical protein